MRGLRSTAAGLLRRAVADPHGVVPGADGADGAPDGTATTLLRAGTARAFHGATAAWQVLMVAAVVVTPGPVGDLLPLLAAHLAVLGLALLGRAGRVPGWATLAGVPVLFVADWAASVSLEGVLLFAACWMMNLASATAVFVVRGRLALALPVAWAVLVPPAMLLVRPDLDSPLPGAVLVTQLSIVSATRVGYSYLADLARQADAAAETAREQRELAAARRAASRTAAEDARVLHDTVVNTLAAVAGGGAATRDHRLVRERCARDVATVAAIRDGRDELPSDALDLRGAADGHGIAVRHEGLHGPALARAEAELDPTVARVVRRAVGELVRNAAKHAGTDAVVLDVAAPDGRLVVRVADDGVGFDGTAPAGRGLERSVLDRAAGVGVGVDVVTAPGAGTAITLTCPAGAAVVEPTDPADPPDAAGAADSPGDLLDAVRVLLRRAAFLWAGGVAAVGLVLAVTNHPGEVTAEYAMVALAAAGAWWAARVVRLPGRPGRPGGPGRLGAGSAIVLALAAAGAFVCSADAVGYGRDEPVLWQAIGSTGLLVLLLELGPRRWWLAALALYAGTVGVLAVGAAIDSLERGAVVVTAGLAGLGLAAAWANFRTTLQAVGRQAHDDQVAAARDRLAGARRQAADRARARWRAAGLADSLALLHDLATGGTRPDDEALRAAAAVEEAYLRQLILLHPDLVEMGTWLARALDLARVRRVEVTVRTGDEDVTPVTAERWGRHLLGLVDTLPAGYRLTVSLFPHPDGARLLLVGDHPHPSRAAAGWTAEATGAVKVQTFAATDVVELDAQAPR